MGFRRGEEEGGVKLGFRRGVGRVLEEYFKFLSVFANSHTNTCSISSPLKSSIKPSDFGCLSLLSLFNSLKKSFKKIEFLSSLLFSHFLPHSVSSSFEREGKREEGKREEGEREEGEREEGEREEGEREEGESILRLLSHLFVHSDKEKRQVVSILLKESSSCVWEMTNEWLSTGSIRDPLHDFFIHTPSLPINNASKKGEGGGGEGVEESSKFVWEGKFKVREERLLFEEKEVHTENELSLLLSPSTANTIFSIGKAIHFTHSSNNDGENHDNTTPSSSGGKEKGEKARGEGKVELRSVEREGMKVVLRNLESGARDKVKECMRKNKLGETFHTVKKYLLLGVREASLSYSSSPSSPSSSSSSSSSFVEDLLSLLSPHLHLPSSLLPLHLLSSSLLSLLHSSNSSKSDSQHSIELAQQLLRVSLLEVSFLEGEDGKSERLGWNSFSIALKVNSPLDVVFHHKATLLYSQIFNFLFRLKASERNLTLAFKALHSPFSSPLSKEQVRVEEASLKVASFLWSEMCNFLKNCQNFFLFDCIEREWNLFQNTLSLFLNDSIHLTESKKGKERDNPQNLPKDSLKDSVSLERLIAVHNLFLQNVRASLQLFSPQLFLHFSSLLKLCSFFSSSFASTPLSSSSLSLLCKEYLNKKKTFLSSLRLHSQTHPLLKALIVKLDFSHFY